MRMDLAQRLKLQDKHYSDLLAQWKIAASKVYQNRNSTGLTNYSVPTEAENDELLFKVFGLNCFMRFRHNFENGTIEYGVVKRHDNDQKLWVPVVSVHFGQRGNLKPPFDFNPVTEYDRTHLEVLALHFDEFLKAAYGQE